MTASAIIAELAEQAWLKQAARNIAGVYADDLYQEFFLLLLEKPQDEITKVYHNGYIKFYSIKIMGRIFKGRGLGSINGFSKFLPESSMPNFLGQLPNSDGAGHYCDYLENYGVDDGISGNPKLEHLAEPDISASFDAERAKEIEQSVLATCHWYDAKIYEMWRGGKSIKTLYRETGIDFRELSSVIKRVKQKMQQQYAN